MLKTRVLTAAILAGLFLAVLFLLPARLAVLVFAAVCALGAWEWSSFGGLKGRGARIAYVVALLVLMGIAWRQSADPHFLRLLLGVAGLWWLVALGWMVLGPAQQGGRLALACGALVLVPAFAALAWLLVTPAGRVSGAERVLWLLLLVIAADVGAYFAGRAFGNLRLAPRISPGKTWEGALGGLCAVAFLSWFGALRMGLNPGLGVLCGCTLGAFSIVGDLTESMFKRAAGLKDSGRILPGHGGVLDRIDGITATAPLYALGWLCFGAGT